MSGGEPVGVSVVDGVARVVLQSAASRNALSSGLLDAFHRALDVIDGATPRAVVLDHEPPAFCAGADLKERRRGPVDSSTLTRALERLRAVPCPTIAVVRGAVRAGGIGLMASCDLVVVRPEVTFAFTEVRIGVAPAIIAVPILERCPWSKLAASFLTGAVFDAGAALDMGLVTHVDGDVDRIVEDLLAGISLGSPAAVAATKALLRHPGTFTDAEALSDRLFSSPDAAEGMAAFADRRPPAWASTQTTTGSQP